MYTGCGGAAVVQPGRVPRESGGGQTSDITTGPAAAGGGTNMTVVLARRRYPAAVCVMFGLVDHT